MLLLMQSIQAVSMAYIGTRPLSHGPRWRRPAVDAEINDTLILPKLSPHRTPATPAAIPTRRL